MVFHQSDLLQGNLNHSAGAQDLFLQHLAEWEIGLAVVAEPYFVPNNHPQWVGDVDGSVAIVAGGGAESPPLVRKEAGRGFVAATWGEYAVVGVYFSPNRPLADLEAYLDALGPVVRRLAPMPVLVMGDLNAKSASWGSAVTDPRGRAVEEWALEFGVSPMNRGTTHTCVRAQGGSVVDVTFATPVAARRVRNWRVLDVETLSDHNYIRFEISTSAPAPDFPHRGPTASPRWVISRLDRQLAEEAATVQAWCTPSTRPTDPDSAAGRLRTALTAVCDASMPRARRRPPRRAVYWWSQEIADLRVTSNEARRQHYRCRRRRAQRDTAEADRLWAEYRATKVALQIAISRAKATAKEELLEGLNRDPWGRPYKLARNKLRVQSRPLAETLQQDFLDRVVGALFPESPVHTPPAMAPPDVPLQDEPEAPPVTSVELEVAAMRLRAKRTAPGPDGVPGKVLGIALERLGDEFRGAFDASLRTGRFPKIWKEGALCLLRKDGKPDDSPSGYRPIVLLSEAGKIFERVLAFRLTRHLGADGPELSEIQFGFRAGRSTLDALSALKSHTRGVVAEGGRALAVSLDIANAFNSLPHATIREALRYFGVPLYLRRILADYLQDREVVCTGFGGRILRRPVLCGVPQGSVLGPLLWNMGYDWVLRGALPAGVRTLCYADDTLVVAQGRTFGETARLAEVSVALTVDRIRLLGLKVALEKTEALLFHGPRQGPPPGAHLVIDGVRVPVKAQMKYLGLVLDGRWGFEAHFRALTPRLVAASAALGRLLPNLGGPDGVCRRLYAGIVRAMALYGAPIYADAITATNRSLLQRAQRIVAVRIIRGYRTVSVGAACALAGTPPWELEAKVLAAVYEVRTAARREERPAAPEEIFRVRRDAEAEVHRRWALALQEARYGRWTIDAVLPVLDRWSRRKHGVLTYRLVQVLSGHGCFGHYLHRVARREPTTECHHCGAADDTAQHTLEVCVAFSRQRHDLTQVVGTDLALSSIIASMLGSEESWRAMTSFCEEVISQKEEAERVREADANSDQMRRRRLGARRRRYAHLLPPT